MKRSIVPVFTLVAFGMLCSSVYCAKDAQAAPSPRRLIATRAKTPPTIDGDLNDTCWQTAARADGFSVYSDPNRPHGESTVGRVCFDDDYLYMSLECKVKEMDKFKARLDQIAGKFVYGQGGVIEVFLDTNHDRKTFQQYLLHANGSSTITLSKGDIFKILNEDYLACKAKVTATGFNVETSFPLAMLHLGPDTARVWGFNLNRSHDLYDESYNKNGFFSSWNSTRGAGFQSPELFGELAVDADLSRFYWRVNFVRDPQPGDRGVELRIKNETGRDFSGKLALAIIPPGAGPVHYEKPVSLRAGAERTVSFEHLVSGADIEAKYKVSLADDTGRVCYLGGTEKVDLTPGDAWSAPAPTAEQSKAGYIVFHRPYTHPVLYKAVPRAGEIVSSLSISACRGEFEPITFALYPLGDIKSLAVSVSDLTGPGGATIPASAIDVRKVMWQSDWRDPRAFEAKEHLLRRFGSLNLTGTRAQRLWLTVKVPDTVGAGDYRGTVSLTAGKTVTRIALTVGVLPFELSPPDEMGYFMYYPGVKHASFSTEDFFKKTVKDMRDHGMTTFTIYSWIRVKDPATGKFVMDVDNHVDIHLGVTYARMMDMLSDGGLGTVAPLLDISSMSYAPDSIVQLYKIYRSRGWPNVLFYINDEIEYPERIAAARKVLEKIKKIAPDIKTTTALGPKGAAALGHMYDVWIGCSRPEMIKKCRSMGKHPWTYSCRAVHDVSPAFERTFFGRFPWKIGLKGVGLWSYSDDNSFFDRFGRRHGYKEFTFSPEWKHQYGHVYFEKGEIIPQVTWEAVREGIDDYRYMLTLKKLAESVLVSTSARVRAAGKAGLKLLEEISDRTPILVDDKKWGRAWQALGDQDAERNRVIEAILKIRTEMKK